MSPAFFWSKACSGVYYAHDTPRGTQNRRHVGKVWRELDGAYRATFQFGDVNITRRDRTLPLTQLANVEYSVRKTLPGARFTREGF